MPGFYPLIAGVVTFPFSYSETFARPHPTPDDISSSISYCLLSIRKKTPRRRYHFNKTIFYFPFFFFVFSTTKKTFIETPPPFPPPRIYSNVLGELPEEIKKKKTRVFPRGNKTWRLPCNDYVFLASKYLQNYSSMCSNYYK